MQTYTHYCWAVTCDGEIKDGMYTRGPSCETRELVPETARPRIEDGERVAVLRVVTADAYDIRSGEPWRRLIAQTIVGFDG